MAGDAAPKGLGGVWGVLGGSKGPLGETVVGSGALCRAPAVAEALRLIKIQWGVLVGEACRFRLSSEGCQLDLQLQLQLAES